MDGKYGKDAQIVNAHGDVIDTKPATAGNQHCAFVNIINTLDEGSTSHGGGTTNITKQDVAVATGVIGVVTGGMALAAAGTTAVGASVTVAGMLNSADDIGTNANGESFMQQQVTTQSGKDNLGIIKTIVSVLGLVNNINTLKGAESTIVQKATGVADTFNSVANNLNSLLNE